MDGYGADESAAKGCRGATILEADIMSRLETKFRLMRELGSVLDPIQRLLLNDAEPDPSRVKVALVLAQYVKDMEAWLRRVRDLCEINGSVLEPY
jgi:hypothetical protein